MSEDTSNLDFEDGPDESEAVEPGGHVVLVDMLTYKVPGRRPGTIIGQRARKGARVVLDPELNNIEYLEDLKAIGPDDGTAYKRTTAKALAEAAGGREDPVPVPENLFDVSGDDVTEAAHAESEDDEEPLSTTPADDE